MAQVVLGVHTGPHDSGASLFDGYSLKAAVQLERLTRNKGDGGEPGPAIDEVLSIAGATHRDVDVVAYSRSLFPTRYFRHIEGWRWLKQQYRTYLAGKPRITMLPEIHRHGTTDIDKLFDIAAYQRDVGFGERTATYFYNHHEAHALPALFYSNWDDALLVTADGGGDTVHYSHRSLHDGKLETIYGGEERMLLSPTEDSLAKLYGYATKALGFRRVRHEGKVTGLSAMGQPVHHEEISGHFSVDDNGKIHSDFKNDDEMIRLMKRLARRSSREDFAASVQKTFEDVMLLSMQRLLARWPRRNLGVAGGAFANVKLNRILVEQLPIDELFIFPAMGDEGLPVGGALAYMLQRDGLAHWLSQRRDLTSLYLGRDFTPQADGALGAIPGIARSAESPIDGAAKRLAAGELGAIYTGRMEYGPRALGARSILANPSRRETHDLLNTRLERSEFMPFAPVVAAERADEIFGISGVNARACRNMTITCDVKPDWRTRIAAVVHVDGSARPQVIERETNPLYYDVLGGFARETGIPVLVNTSFNVHEEPIVNTPAECARALLDGRIDFVVTNQALYVKRA
jgi:carbamoyltransferase